MEISPSYLEQIKKRGVHVGTKSERQDLIARFVEKINTERKGTQWKPVTAARINMLISFLKVPDLYWLLGECEKAESFSKKFFGMLKNKK